MLGISTRLRLSVEQENLLSEYLETFSTLVRTAYQQVNTGKLEADKKVIYAWASVQGLTSHQANSLSAQVEQYRTTDQAVLQYRIETLRLRIDALELEVKQLDARIKQTKTKAGKFFKKEIVEKLNFRRFQKHRSLCNKRQKLEQLENQLSKGKYSRVFGGAKLL